MFGESPQGAGPFEPEKPELYRLRKTRPDGGLGIQPKYMCRGIDEAVGSGIIGAEAGDKR